MISCSANQVWTSRTHMDTSNILYTNTAPFELTDMWRNRPRIIWFHLSVHVYTHSLSLSIGTTALGQPWPPGQSTSRHLDPLLSVSIFLYRAYAGHPQDYPAIVFCLHYSKLFITVSVLFIYKKILLWVYMQICIIATYNIFKL